jgi:hypothetical protein
MTSTSININMESRGRVNIVLIANKLTTSVKKMVKEITSDWDKHKYLAARKTIMNADNMWYKELPGTGGNTSPGVDWTKVVRSEDVSSQIAPMFKDTMDVCILYVICEMICQCMKEGKLSSTEWTFPELDTDWSNPEAVLKSYRELCEVPDDDEPEPPPYKRSKPNTKALVPFNSDVVLYEKLIDSTLKKYCDPVVLSNATFRGQLEDSLYNGIERTAFLKLAERIFDRLMQLKVVQIQFSTEEQKRMAEEQKRMAEEQKRMAEEQKRMAEEQKTKTEEQKTKTEEQKRMKQEAEGKSLVEIETQKSKAMVEIEIEKGKVIVEVERQKRKAMVEVEVERNKGRELEFAIEQEKRAATKQQDLVVRNDIGSAARRKPCPSIDWVPPTADELKKVSPKAKRIQGTILSYQKVAAENPAKANFVQWRKIVKNSTVELSDLKTMVRCDVFEQRGRNIKKKFNTPSASTGQIQSIVLLLVNQKNGERTIKQRLTRM